MVDVALFDESKLGVILFVCFRNTIKTFSQLYTVNRRAKGV